MEYTKGEIEYSQLTSNAIDLISKETGETIAQVISDDDELGATEIATACRIETCWNSHDTLKKQRDELLKACEALVNAKVLKDVTAATKLAKAAIAAVKE